MYNVMVTKQLMKKDNPGTEYDYTPYLPHQYIFTQRHASKYLFSLCIEARMHALITQCIYIYSWKDIHALCAYLKIPACSKYAYMHLDLHTGTCTPPQLTSSLSKMSPSRGRDIDHWFLQSSNMMMLRTVDNICCKISGCTSKLRRKASELCMACGPIFFFLLVRHRNK